MSSQYDKIGGHYDNIKTLPLDRVQTATALACIGNIEGQEVLDLACGSGYYARKAVDQGARRVVGLDISSAMVEAARHKLGGEECFEFHVADCSKPLNVGKFDVVLAMWLLNYAASSDEQLAMWRNMYAHVKPGGRCIGIIPNFNRFNEKSPDSQYGSQMKLIEHVPDGVKYQCTLGVDPPISFEGYLLRRDVYESCAQKAGFVDLQWLDPIDPKDPQLDFNALPRHMICQVFEVRRAN